MAATVVLAFRPKQGACQPAAFRRQIRLEARLRYVPASSSEIWGSPRSTWHARGRSVHHRRIEGSGKTHGPGRSPRLAAPTRDRFLDGRITFLPSTTDPRSRSIRFPTLRLPGQRSQAPPWLAEPGGRRIPPLWPPSRTFRGPFRTRGTALALRDRETMPGRVSSPSTLASRDTRNFGVGRAKPPPYNDACSGFEKKTKKEIQCQIMHQLSEGAGPSAVGPPAVAAFAAGVTAALVGAGRPKPATRAS